MTEDQAARPGSASLSGLMPALHLDRMRAAYSDLVAEPFTSQADWTDWLGRNRWAADPETIETMLAHAGHNGVSSLWLGHSGPGKVKIIGKGHNRFAVARGWAYPRHRLMLDLAAAFAGDNHAATRIYAPEALSRFALALRGRFPRFTGSEYRPDAAAAAELYPVQHQDLTALTLPGGAFDLVLTQEVLEHVADLRAAMREMARVLKPGGVMASTFPFHSGRAGTVIRARVEDGQVQHLMAPEYHVDGVRRTRDSLVFSDPGWDILDMARAGGFTSAAMVFVSSRSGAIMGQHLAGLWCLIAVR